MNFDEKIAMFKKDSAAKVIRPTTAWPLFCRGLRLAGLKVPPPSFWPAPLSALYHALLCIVLWGLSMVIYFALTKGVYANYGDGMQLFSAIFGYGIIVGGLKSFNYHSIKKRMGLSTWLNYPQKSPIPMTTKG